MKRSKVLETILAFMVMLGVVYWLNKNPWWLLLALVLGVTGLLFKKPAEKICMLWEKVTAVIGSIMNKVVLTVVFIFILVPLSFLSRAFKRKTVNGSMEHSYFRNRNTTYTKGDLENTW
jgi:hypothetical protein